MRKNCIDLLHSSMAADDSIVVLTADLGFGILDRIRDDYPDRFHNVGAAENLLIGAGIGLIEAGKVAVCYSISSFLLYRPFEMLRTYVNHERIPLRLIGSGRDKDYSHDGISHWAHDDEEILKPLRNIEIYKPSTISELESWWPSFLYNRNPTYLNLTRKI